jgi:hypothetical protein
MLICGRQWAGVQGSRAPKRADGGVVIRRRIDI